MSLNLSMGIVGLPNVGKSTLFNILTDSKADAKNYPFCTIDPNIGVVAVPDERLEILANISISEKIIPAVVEFFDIAGLVKGANKGEGLGNQFLSHIREVDAIIMVLRVFESDSIVHVENSVNPVRDMDIINMELALKDLEVLERVSKKLDGEVKTGDKKALNQMEAINEIIDILQSGEFKKGKNHKKYMDVLKERSIKLLSTKKQLYLLNGKKEDIKDDLKEKIKGLGCGYVNIDLASERNVSDLIKASYKELGLISFFTTGEKETRAWTVKGGSSAPMAAGVIHSDFEDKFIRAEVIHYEKLKEAGSMQAAKQKGWLRIEGKDYVVEDGDVMNIRHG